MENYLDEILMTYADKQLYENGPTYKTCIEAFREHIPVNSVEYENLNSHFNWLRFEMEPHSLFLDCHMKDFIGNMRLLCFEFDLH